MKIETFVLVAPGCETYAANKPWSLEGYPSGSKWYRLTAEVPDPIPSETVASTVEEVK